MALSCDFKNSFIIYFVSVCELGPSVFLNKVLVKICGDCKGGGTIGLKNLRNKEPRNLYSLPNVILLTK